MERVNKTNKSFQFFGAGCGPKTVIYVAAEKFWLRTVKLIETSLQLVGCFVSHTGKGGVGGHLGFSIFEIFS